MARWITFTGCLRARRRLVMPPCLSITKSLAGTSFTLLKRILGRSRGVVGSSLCGTSGTISRRGESSIS
jgi:hypothetical protein